LLLGAELSGLTNVFWVTLGGRVLTAESGTTGLMHFEAGAWFLAAFGVGYSQRLWGGAFDEINLHTFIGFPAPLAEVSTHRMFYIVFPYYRPMLGLASGNVVHEIGLMVKFSTFSAIR
jgi:hypothetical protein